MLVTLDQLLVQQVSSKVTALLKSCIFYYNNFDREGPREANVYILLNVATECSRNYTKNIHRGFNCSRVKAANKPALARGRAQSFYTPSPSYGDEFGKSRAPQRIDERRL